MAWCSSIIFKWFNYSVKRTVFVKVKIYCHWHADWFWFTQQCSHCVVYIAAGFNKGRIVSLVNWECFFCAVLGHKCKFNSGISNWCRIFNCINSCIWIKSLLYLIIVKCLWIITVGIDFVILGIKNSCGINNESKRNFKAVDSWICITFINVIIAVQNTIWICYIII